MTRLAEIEAHIVSMSELLAIVGAMRSLASMRIQEADRALPGIRRYSETIAAAMGAALLMAPRPGAAAGAARGRRALVLCSAEHGFVGGFNERVLDAAEASIARGDALFVLGSRGAAAARERGKPVLWAHPTASRPAGAPEAVRHLTAELYRFLASGGATAAEVIFARYRPGEPFAIERRQLFPVDPAALPIVPPRQLPLHTLPPAALLERLIADYVFALLTEAAVETFASENAARFAAMEAAHDNVGAKLHQLRDDARTARQSEITEELLDLVSGSGALALPPAAPRNGPEMISG
jgi:F-type H+-transporting ATPase subunit gamma